MRWIAGSVLLAVVLAWSLVRLPRRSAPYDTHRSLVVYCAAGIKAPVEAAAAAYQEEYGVQVVLQYGGSGTLLSNLAVADSGDLYIAGDDSYLELAADRGLVAERFDLARMSPVLAVPRGNPKAIRGLQDLRRADLAVGLANPDAAAVGKIVREVLQASGDWQQTREHAKVFKPTVNDLATDVKLGAVDVAVTWDATLAQYPDLEAVHDPALDASERHVTLGVLRRADPATPALRFARYLSAADRGLQHFRRAGFRPVEGDLWDPNPHLVLMSGAMLNPAIDDTVAEFEQREGVLVERLYNGCGILVSQMKSGELPDAYFSCDQSFMDEVAEHFQEPVVMSANRMVLLVQPGNPNNLGSLADLTRKGLRVGLAHPEKSALGALTQRLLRLEGLSEEFERSGNWKLDSATGDFLVNQMRTRSLDAAVVYASNATLVADHLDWIELDSAAALAVQPFAVGRDSRHRSLLRRLRERLGESRRRFEDLGFEWRGAGEEE